MLLVDGSTLPPVVTLWRNRTTTSTPMAYQFDYTFTAFSVPKHQNIGICLHFKHRTFCRVVRDRLSGGNRTPRTNCPVSKRYITNLIMYRFDTSPPGWCIVLIHPHRREILHLRDRVCPRCDIEISRARYNYSDFSGAGRLF